MRRWGTEIDIPTATGFNPRTHTGCDYSVRFDSHYYRWFQSTHPHGVRRITYHTYVCFIVFQSTHPHGVRPDIAHEDILFDKFQSTHPHGVRQSLTLEPSDEYVFQSTHPHGVRLSIISGISDQRSFQSTHPHGVRLAHVIQFFRLIDVSIHAPTRGATGALFADGYSAAEVSIHAPTRGATDQSRYLRTQVIEFQSTHPHGVRRLPSFGIMNDTQVFQSTHPHGVRRIRF